MSQFQSVSTVTEKKQKQRLEENRPKIIVHDPTLECLVKQDYEPGGRMFRDGNVSFIFYISNNQLNI